MPLVDAWLPYGKSQVCLRIPTRNFLGSIEPKEKPGTPDPIAEIERALKEPLGSKKLNEIVKPESTVAIVVDDASGTAPTKLMIEPLLDTLNSEGVKNENVTLIFACGLHRAVKPEEAKELLGEQVCTHVKFLSHDCRAQDLARVGTTRKHGTEVLLNRSFTQADVKILTGDIGIHYFAGYSGGRKSVLPGISSEEAIKHNHALLLDPNAKTGSLSDNPVNQDMVEAAAMARVDFALNVVMNSKREIVKAFAGELDRVFSEGVKLFDEMFRMQVDRRAEIVVVSPGGDPADTSLFKAYQSLDNALEVVKRGGVIILVAELAEGHGNQDFCEWMTKFQDLKSVEKEIKRSFVLGGSTAYYYTKAMQKARIILVSSMPDYYAANVFKLKTARAVNDALNEAMNMVGKNAKIWTLPYGNCTLTEVKAFEDQGVATAG
jgi:nickel-dependent lactate racemase